MNLGALELYAEVMRTRSFAAVAREQNLDPSSVSRAVAQLEQELSFQLFHRSTRKLIPTEAGLTYSALIEPLLEELRHARLQALDLSEQPHGILRIHAPVSFGQLKVVPVLPEFSVQFPAVQLELVLNDRPLGMQDERIDVALRTQPVTEVGFVAQRLSPITSQVCASPDYLSRFGRPQQPADLKEHSCLLLQMPGFSDAWRFKLQGGSWEEVKVRGPVRSSNALALKDLAVAGMGLILQAQWIVERELANGQLMDVFPNFEVSGAELEDPAVWLLYPSKAYFPLKVRMFVEYLQRQFRSETYPDALRSPTRSAL